MSVKMGRPAQRATKRFLKHVLFESNGCWTWIGARGPTGLPLFRGGPRGNAVGARRFALEAFGRKWVPSGTSPVHLFPVCGNVACVNHRHLIRRFVGVFQMNEEELQIYVRYLHEHPAESVYERQNDEIAIEAARKRDQQYHNHHKMCRVCRAKLRPGTNQYRLARCEEHFAVELPHENAEDMLAQYDRFLSKKWPHAEIKEIANG